MALTVTLSGHAVAERLRAASIPVLEEADGDVTIPAANVVEAGRFLRDDEDLDCKYLNCLTAVDRMDTFEVVYHMSSLAKNRGLVLKARLSHDMPVMPSVMGVWQGAMLQEREAYDLMGIAFDGHPGLKRIFLWEGFPGHPLRKDFLALPGGFKPGLQRFPFEFPSGQRSYPTLRDTDQPSAPSVPRVASAPEAAIDRTAVEVPALPQPAIGEAGSTPLREEVPSARGSIEPIGVGTDPSLAGGTAGESDTHSLPTDAESQPPTSTEPGAGPSEQQAEHQIDPEQPS